MAQHPTQGKYAPPEYRTPANEEPQWQKRAFTDRMFTSPFMRRLIARCAIIGVMALSFFGVVKWLGGMAPNISMPDISLPEEVVEVQQRPIVIEELITKAEFCGAEVTAVLKQSVSTESGWIPTVIKGSKLEGVVYGQAQACLDTAGTIAEQGAWLPDEDVTISLPNADVTSVSIIWPETDPANCSAGIVERFGSFFGDGDACDSIRQDYNVEAHEALIEATARSQALDKATAEYGIFLRKTARAFGHTGDMTFTQGGQPFSVDDVSLDEQVRVLTPPTRKEQTDNGDGGCDMHDDGFQGPCIPQDYEDPA